MTVKFKIGFTIDSQTMFELLSKFLPIEQLSVEEVLTREARPQPDPAIRFDKRFDLPKPPSHKRKTKPIHSRKFDFTAGANKTILDVFVDGMPHTFAETKAALIANKYSGTGVGSKLARLVEYGKLTRLSYGHYKLVTELPRKNLFSDLVGASHSQE